MKQGFTLVEIIIYVAILSLIIVTIVQITLTVSQSRSRLLTTSVVHSTATRILNQIDYFVKNSDGWVEDSSNRDCVFENKLWLYFADTTHIPPGCFGDESSGAISIEYNSTTNELELLCFHDYPNQGQNATCADNPKSTSTTTIDLTDNSLTNIGVGDFRLTTTTLGSREAVITTLIIGTHGGPGGQLVTTTASSTSPFLIIP